MNALLKCRDFLLDRPFGLVTGLYVVALALSLGCVLCTVCKAGHYEAARDLERNHRLSIGDVRRQNEFATSLGFYTVPPLFAGKYTTAKIDAKKELSAAHFAERADIKVEAGKRALPFPLSANSPPLALLDAGTAVVLVTEGTDAKPAVQVPAKVLAIVCQAGKSEMEGCYPVLEIDDNRIQDVLKNPGPRLLLSSQQ
jgi:hypothetical protein